MPQPLLYPQHLLFRWPGQDVACLGKARFRGAPASLSPPGCRTCPPVRAVGLTPML